MYWVLGWGAGSPIKDPWSQGLLVLVWQHPPPSLSSLTQILTLPNPLVQAPIAAYAFRVGVHTWLALLLQQTRRCLPSLAHFFLCCHTHCRRRPPRRMRAGQR